MKKIITYILGLTAITSMFLATGIKEVANWWDIAKPFFIVFIVCISIALIINNINYIRRITYPTLVCLSSWAYKHKVIKTKFTRRTYSVYKLNNYSYKKLFGFTQDLFDIYLEGLNK